MHLSARTNPEPGGTLIFIFARQWEQLWYSNLADALSGTWDGAACAYILPSTVRFQTSSGGWIVVFYPF